MAAVSPWQPVNHSELRELDANVENHSSDSVSYETYKSLSEHYRWLSSEHDEVRRKYDNLRRALLHGGAAGEAIEALAQANTLEQAQLSGQNGFGAHPQGHDHGLTPLIDTSIPSIALSPTQGWDQDGWQSPWAAKRLSPNNPTGSQLQPDRSTWHHGASAWSHNVTGDDDRTADWVETISRSKSPQKDRHTISITNLPPDIAHKEITTIIRGGRLVEVWLRRNERAAAVTFESANAAANFVQFAKRISLTLRGHKVEVGWNDRQFEINPQLKDKLSRGHSRNLVIRGGAERLGEDRIRNDMDHVHNLIITAVVTRGADIYVSTNSVGGAQFAQTCMRSRKDYKPFKIEWYPDECDEPLPEAPPPAPKPARTPLAKPKPQQKTAPANRFDLLDLGDALDGDSDADSSNTSGVNIQPRSTATDS